MRVRILRAVYLGGEVQPAGSEHDLTDALARQLIASGKAEPAGAAPPAAGPMTTETAAAVVSGKKVKAKESPDAG